MFEVKSCFGGAVVVWLLATAWFGSAWKGAVMAAIPFGFGVAGLARR